MNQTVKSKLEGTTTMLNLQSKRTLPRDVIKWIQGLDLSYSVKDYRKDLSNGFLIGEIVSRYEPGKIPMHAFQNSQNQARRDNNWAQLQLFFRKYELRRIKIDDMEYNLIQNNNDHKSEQLFEFICRLYSVCTKRTLPETPPTLDLPPTQSKNPNLTASYLLKDQGLQKLQNSQMSNSSNQEIDKFSQDRVPTRKIGPSPIDMPAKVDVKGIGIKQQINRKMTSKRKSWEMKTESMYEETNQYIQKYVFDYLNEILEDCLPAEDSNSNQIRVLFTNSNQRPTEILKRNLNIDKNLVVTFFNEVKGAISNILTAMLKELNEIWKFFAYFIRMLSFFNENSEEFAHLIALLSTYATSSQLNEKKKIQKVFLESLISILVSEVKSCTSWAKRQKIMAIIYDFTGRQLDDKKVVLLNLKERLGSSNPLYISWLSVLVQEEKIENSSEKLVQDFIYYAHQNLSSTNYVLRLSALKILSTICQNGWSNLVKDYFMNPDTIRKFRAVTEFQQIYYVSSIYFCLLGNLLQSHEYQTLIKGKNQGNANTIKVYNPDHEKQSQQIKQKLQLLSLTISKLYFNSNSQTVREVIAKQSTAYLGQTIPLILVVISYLSTNPSLKSFEDFCEQQKTYYEFKTSKVLINAPNIEQLKESSNEILAQMIKVHRFSNENKANPNLHINAEMEHKIEDQLLLFQFCFQNLNIKKLNMELWTSIADTYIQTITEFLYSDNEEYRKLSEDILCKVYTIQFNYDMKIDDLNLYLAQAITQCSKKSEPCSFEKIKSLFEQEFKRGNSEQVKSAAHEINQLLGQKGVAEFLSLKQ